MFDLTHSPAKLLQRWRTHCTLVRTRRALLNLSAEQLRDIGLSEAEALREAWRPIWDSQTPQGAQARRHEYCRQEDSTEYPLWRPS